MRGERVRVHVAIAGHVAIAAMILLGSVPAAAELDFASWLEELRQEALERGIGSATVDAALAGISPIPRVLELDRHQPESSLAVDRYVAHVVTRARVREGRARLAGDRRVLEQTGRRYGIPAAVIVALWGVETSYGRATGDFPVIAALATLAYDGRRSALFREELLAALRILDDGDVPPEAMRGSWAGAMGQSQFMPSSFLRYAVDADGNGRRDIWQSRPDVFASIANYLAQTGWRPGEPWGQRVRLPDGFDRGAAAGAEKRLAEWGRLGVRRADGRGLGTSPLLASLVLPQGESGPAFLIHENGRVLMRWNRSLAFAVAVGRLADRIAGGPVGAVRRSAKRVS